MQKIDIKTPRLKVVKEFIIVFCVVLLLGVMIAWYNTGNLHEGLHLYATSIIIMLVGCGLIFYPSKAMDMVGVSVFTAGLIFMLTGISFG